MRIPAFLEIEKKTGNSRDYREIPEKFKVSMAAIPLWRRVKRYVREEQHQWLMNEHRYSLYY